MGLLRKRDTLEIIIDSCSSGEAVLGGLDQLIHDAQTREPRIFADYQVTIPIQIDTETKKRVFPEFLDIALNGKPKGILEKFYQRHRDHVNIVETDVSLAYKWGYLTHAQRVLQEHPGWAENIVGNARKLNMNYGIGLSHAQCPSLGKLHALCERAAHDWAEQQFEFGNMRRARASYLSQRTDANGGAIDQEVRAAEVRQLNRRATRFFTGMDMADKLLIQAMYSHDPLNNHISGLSEFRSYRRDKGERAIESYVFGRGDAADPGRVTLIVTEDGPARKKIEKLRSDTNNTAFAVSSYGLERALDQLSLLQRPLSHAAQRKEVERRRHNAALLRESGHTFGMNDVLVPEIEEKWANRLVEVMKTGQWTGRSRGRDGAPGMG